MKPHETGDIYRLYVREWVIVHTVDAPAAEPPYLPASGALTKAMDWIRDNLKGRVKHGDVNVQMNTDLDGYFWAHVQVFKENLKGEFKTRGGAELFASINNHDEYTIVPRNSAADHEIRNYGVTKL